MVWRILSTTGVENGSDVKVSFDPTYERLTFHSVVIHRGARRIDALDPAAVKVIQQEEELERRLYDGRLTAVVFLRGVRAGDAVDAMPETPIDRAMRFAAKHATIILLIAAYLLMRTMVAWWQR